MISVLYMYISHIMLLVIGQPSQVPQPIPKESETPESGGDPVIDQPCIDQKSETV